MGMALIMRVNETDAMIVVAHQASEKWNVDSQKWTSVALESIFAYLELVDSTSLLKSFTN